MLVGGAIIRSHDENDEAVNTCHGSIDTYGAATHTKDRFYIRVCVREGGESGGGSKQQLLAGGYHGNHSCRQDGEPHTHTHTDCSEESLSLQSCFSFTAAPTEICLSQPIREQQVDSDWTLTVQETFQSHTHTHTRIFFTLCVRTVT